MIAYALLCATLSLLSPSIHACDAASSRPCHSMPRELLPEEQMFLAELIGGGKLPQIFEFLRTKGSAIPVQALQNFNATYTETFTAEWNKLFAKPITDSIASYALGSTLNSALKSALFNKQVTIEKAIGGRTICFSLPPALIRFLSTDVAAKEICLQAQLTYDRTHHRFDSNEGIQVVFDHSAERPGIILRDPVAGTPASLAICCMNASPFPYSLDALYLTKHARERTSRIAGPSGEKPLDDYLKTSKIRVTLNPADQLCYCQYFDRDQIQTQWLMPVYDDAGPALAFFVIPDGTDREGRPIIATTLNRFPAYLQMFFCCACVQSRFMRLMPTEA